jgi:glutathione-specific gamma-glutamylcyclotransferase
MLELTRALIDARHPSPIDIDVDRSTDVPDTELRDQLRSYLQDAPMRERVWVFAYGSLLWKPAVPVERSIRATVYGFRRQFCLHQVRSRGRPERPCLMLALDRGGSCVSLLQEVRGDNLEDALWPLWHREMRGHGYRARWVNAHTEAGVVRALTFIAHRHGPRFLDRLSLTDTAEYIATGCGPRGACADYLRETVMKLEQLRIRDSYMWALQRLVADKLSTPPTTAPQARGH